MSAEGVSPDDGRDYRVLTERAVADSVRGVELSRAGIAGVASGVPQAAAAVCTSLFGVTNAILAVADRLDTLLGAAFDELRPVATVGFPGGFEAARELHEDELEDAGDGDSVQGSPPADGSAHPVSAWGADPADYRMLRRLEVEWDPGDAPPVGWELEHVASALRAAQCRSRWAEGQSEVAAQAAWGAESAIEELLKQVEEGGA